MFVRQLIWRPDAGWDTPLADIRMTPQLVLAFWSVDSELVSVLSGELDAAFPHACIAGCSSAGEVTRSMVLNGSLTATLVQFESASVQGTMAYLDTHADSVSVGETLGQSLPSNGLRHVFVFADGLHVNGTALLRGLALSIPSDASVTGGLAGDDERFLSTSVLMGTTVASGLVAAVGLYGPTLKIAYGSQGGWDAFGPEHRVTKAAGNILYEVDGQPALSLFEDILCLNSARWPESGLRFPLCMREDGSEQRCVRTVLGVDQSRKSLSFGGDVPPQAVVQFMMCMPERLVDGAIDAAGSALLLDGAASLALMVSCVGRKLALKSMVEDEVDGVCDIIGWQAVFTGFYSYGEFAPLVHGGQCVLHNQTMTVTSIGEG